MAIQSPRLTPRTLTWLSTSQAAHHSRTSYPAIANAPLPAEGSGSFSNYHLAALNLAVPFLIQRFLPFSTGFYTYVFLLIVGFVPVTISYWVVTSRFGPRVNEKVPFPGKPLDHYIELKSDALQREYAGKKIPMQILHDAYFDGKADFKGDVLEVMEYRHDWASFGLTAEVCLTFHK